MRRIKNPKFGEYVMLTKWGDKDPHDPWYIGTLEGIMKLERGMLYKVKQSERWFRYCFRITPEEGEEWIRLFGDKDKTTRIEVKE